jgi:hypothetical protein
MNVNMRFPLRLKTKIDLLGRPTETGETRSVWSGGAIIETDQAGKYRRGQTGYVDFEWPALLNGEVRLKLHTRVRVVEVHEWGIDIEFPRAPQLMLAGVPKTNESRT